MSTVLLWFIPETLKTAQVKQITLRAFWLIHKVVIINERPAAFISSSAALLLMRRDHDYRCTFIFTIKFFLIPFPILLSISAAFYAFPPPLIPHMGLQEKAVLIILEFVTNNSRPPPKLFPVKGTLNQSALTWSMYVREHPVHSGQSNDLHPAEAPAQCIATAHLATPLIFPFLLDSYKKDAQLKLQQNFYKRKSKKPKKKHLSNLFSREIACMVLLYFLQKLKKSKPPYSNRCFQNM